MYFDIESISLTALKGVVLCELNGKELAIYYKDVLKAKVDMRKWLPHFLPFPDTLKQN